MSTTTTKRVAQIFLDAKDAEKVLERLRADAQKWIIELEKAPKGSKAALDASKNLAQISAQYNRIERSIRGSNEELKKSEGLYGRMQKMLGPLGTAIAGAFAAQAIWGFVKAQGQVVVEFDKMSSRVRAVGPEFKQRFGELREEAIKTSAAFGMTGKEGLEAIEALGKAGLNVNSIIGGALKGALSLAASGDMPVEMAAEFVAGVQTQFKLVGEDIPHLADLLAAGAGKAQGSVSDLSAAMKQSGLVAAQMGIGINEDVGVLAAFASNALIGSDAGTSFRTMLLRLSNPSKEASDIMKQLNLNVYDGQGKFVGMASVAGQLQKSMSGLTQAQRDQMLATVFGSDAVRAANVLMQQGEQGIRDWTAAVNDQGFAEKVAAEKLDNLSGDLKKANAAWEAFVLDIENGDGPISRTFRNIVSGFTGMLEALTGTGDVRTSLKEFTAIVQDQYTKLGGMGQLLAEEGDAYVASLRHRVEAAKDYGNSVEDLQLLEASRNLTVEQGLALEKKFRNEGVNGAAAITDMERIQLAARQAALKLLDEEITKRMELLGLSTASPAQAGAPGTPPPSPVLTEEQKKAAADAAKKAAADAAKKAAEDIKRLTETVRKAGDEMLRARMSGMEREVAVERDKYAAMREQAHGNTALLTRITELEGQAVLAIRAKYAQQEAEAARKLAADIRAIRMEQVRQDGGPEQLELEAIRRDYAQRIEAARSSAGAIATLEAELAAAIEAKTKEANDQRVTANELALQAIRDGYADQLAAAEGNAQQTLAIEEQLATDLQAAREKQAAQPPLPTGEGTGEGSRLGSELEALRKDYAARIELARTSTGTLAAIEAEMDAAIATHLAEREARQRIANERELQDIRTSYAARFEAAKGNAQQTLALEDQLANDLQTARAKQAAQPPLPTGEGQGVGSGVGSELDAIRATYAARIAAAKDTNTTVLQLQDELEAALTAKQVEQYAARKAQDAQELQDIRAQYAERLAAAKQLAQELQQAAQAPLPTGEGTEPGGRVGSNEAASRIAAAQQAAAALAGIEAELANALALKRQEQVEGAVATQVAITDATVQGYADRLGRTAAADRAEVDATISKYDALFIAAQGDAAKRAELEVLLGNELRDVRTRQLAERQQELDEWDAKLVRNAAEVAGQMLSNLEAKHAREMAEYEKHGGDLKALLERQAAERAGLTTVVQAGEIQALNDKYQVEYDLADAAGMDTTQLQQQHGEEMAALMTKFREEELAATDENNEAVIESFDKRNNRILNAASGLAGSLQAIVDFGYKQKLDELQGRVRDVDDAIADLTEQQKKANTKEDRDRIQKQIDALKAQKKATEANMKAVEEQQKRMKIFSIAQALIATYLAANKTLAEFPGPVGIAMAAAEIVVGLANVATMQAHEEGGFTAQPNGRSAMRGSRRKGEIPAAKDISWWDEQMGANVTLGQVPQYKSDIAAGGPVKSASYGLIGEKGPEYVVPNDAMNRPDVAPYIDYIDEIRTKKPALFSVPPPVGPPGTSPASQPSWFPTHSAPIAMMEHVQDQRTMHAYAMGGFTAPAMATAQRPTRGTALVNAAGPNTGNGPIPPMPTDPMLLAVLDANQKAILALHQRIEDGIGINYDLLQQSQGRIAAIGNTNNISL